MNRIKVAFFAEILIEDFDGASRTMFQLIKRIDKSKFEFLFICGVGPDKIQDFECLKIPVINLPINAGYTMALPGMVKKEIKKKLKTFKPDVIHIATPSLLGSFSLKYANKHNLPVITIYHTHFISYIDYYLKHTPFLINRVKQVMAENQKEFYNKCDKIYVPAESIKNELEVIGIMPSKMKIWKRGIDNELFSPKHSDPELIRKLVGNEHPTIIFASRLVWEKNLETLFRIYDKIQACEMDINLLIVGDGGANKACLLKMPKAVFTGKVNHQELAVLYASTDLFVFPSVSESYGNVVLEAMASGLPCVIADGGGSKDFIEQGYNFESKGKRILVAMGRPVKRKGFSWFIKNVMPLLHTDFILLLIGPVSTKKKMHQAFNIMPKSIRRKMELFSGFPSDEYLVKKLIKKESCSRVKRLGKLPLEDIQAIMGVADAFVMPNIEVEGDMEGFGLVCLEASMCGTKVFASASGGITDAIVHGKNGVLLPSADAGSWVKFLNQIIEEPDFIQLKSDEIISFTRHHYSWRKMCDEYLLHFSNL